MSAPGSVVVILTTYNRPLLVRDAILSVAEQATQRPVRLIIMDDGCSPEARAAIAHAIQDGFSVSARRIVPEGEPFLAWGDERVVWWKGRDRPMVERKATIPYSYTINVALNTLLTADDDYIAYLCDDDYLYPESIEARANFLDTHPDAMVCYGRTRSVQFDAGGRNRWEHAAAPSAGRHYSRPTGVRVPIHGGSAFKTYFDPVEEDPDTGLPYVEEGYWERGPLWYGSPHRVDHNQVMHRRGVLDFASRGSIDGRREYWGEELYHGVGDAAFFTSIRLFPFWGVDAWSTTKRYHALSDGVSAAEVRE